MYILIYRCPTFDFFGRRAIWGHGVPRWHSDWWWGSKQGAFLFLFRISCKTIGYQDIDDPDSVGLELTLLDRRELKVSALDKQSVDIYSCAQGRFSSHKRDWLCPDCAPGAQKDPQSPRSFTETRVSSAWFQCAFLSIISLKTKFTKFTLSCCFI